MHDLHRFLVDYDIAMLRALAQNRGIALATNRKTEAADHLATALLEPVSVSTALAHLSPQARDALELVLASGGRMRAPHFARRFGRVRPMGPGRLERETPWKDPANPTEELWYAGLVFFAFFKDRAGPGEFICVPQDLLPLLPQPQGEPLSFSVEAVPPAAYQAKLDESGSAFVEDLFAYLVYLQTHDVRPYADGRLGRRDLARIRGRLLDADGRRLIFLRHLAQSLGLVVRQGEALRLEATTARQWLISSPARQLAALQVGWREDPTWNDLCRVPALVCDQEPRWQQRHDPVMTRKSLLALLARVPPDAWWTLDSFLRAVKDFHPDFQRPDGDYTSWYIRDAASGEYLAGFESWERVEGALITDLFIGALRWLGVVATSQAAAVSEGVQPILCRLTESGARLLASLPQAEQPEGQAQSDAEPEELPPPPIQVGADFSVKVPSPANLYTRFQLERFADLESTQPCRYTLTVRGLSRALARGIQVEQVLAFLQQASETAIPANVAGQLRLWAGRFGQVELEEVAVLKVKNERVLRELSVLPSTQPLLGQVLSPTMALVPRRNLPRLRKALAELGFLLSPPADPVEDPS